MVPGEPERTRLLGLARVSSTQVKLPTRFKRRLSSSLAVFFKVRAGAPARGLFFSLGLLGHESDGVPLPELRVPVVKGDEVWVGEAVVFRDFAAFEREIFGGFTVLKKIRTTVPCGTAVKMDSSTEKRRKKEKSKKKII